MSKENDGGPAFAKSGNYESDNNSPDYDSKNQDGMSLRDYFAAAAMASLIRLGSSVTSEVKRNDGTSFDFPDMPYYFGYSMECRANGEMSGAESLAVDSYMIADAMLEARAK